MKTPTVYIQTKIAEREATLVELDQQQSALDQKRITTTAELGAYRDMLANMGGAVVPVPTVKSTGGPTPSVNAFQMSRDWTVVLMALQARGKSFDAADVVQMGRENGVPFTVPSVRSQFAHYVKRGYLRKVSRGRYNVTTNGKEKFASAARELNLVAAQQPKENEPPSGGSDTGVFA